MNKTFVGETLEEISKSHWEPMLHDSSNLVNVNQSE